MLIIDSSAAMARALGQPLDPHLRRLLTTRRDQLAGNDDAARFLVVEPGDSVATVEAALGFPLVTAPDRGVYLDDEEAVPCWEWAEAHPGGWTELAFVLSDDGASDVLLVPDHDGVDPDLTALLRVHVASHDQHVGALSR